MRSQTSELSKRKLQRESRKFGLVPLADSGQWSPMRLASLRQFALSLPQTTVVKQWGECLVFKVVGKMFVILVMDGEVIEAVTFKCTPEEFDDLTQIDDIIQAPYCAKRHWVSVRDLGALSPEELERRIRRSYDLVVAKLPKKIQATLNSEKATPRPA